MNELPPAAVQVSCKCRSSLFKLVDSDRISGRLRPRCGNPEAKLPEGRENKKIEKVRTDTCTARGYGKEDFAEAFRRYIPRSEVETLRAAALEAEAHREAAAAGGGAGSNAPRRTAAPRGGERVKAVTFEA